MTDISKRIKEILEDNTDFITENQKMGGITGFARNENHNTQKFRDDDARRKQIERQGEKRLKDIKKHKEDGINPRLLLNNEMKFTLKETFLVKLLEYAQTNKRKYIDDAVKLMEEYPKLKAWVLETSHKALPSQPFALYTLREWFAEEVGTECERVGSGPHIWSLSETALEYYSSNFDESMVLECRVSPNKVLIYMPAFAKMMEELILSGKIMETIGNPVRETFRRKECITNGDINKGLITKINKGK